MQDYDELYWTDPMLGEDEIYLNNDFLCVSYMTRCTLILSMFEGLFFDFSIKRTDKEKIGELRLVYRQFEIDTFEFMTKMINKGHIVLFSSSLDAKFVDINEICLAVMDQKGICKFYRYAGPKKKYVTGDLSDVQPVCLISSQSC